MKKKAVTMILAAAMAMSAAMPAFAEGAEENGSIVIGTTSVISAVDPTNSGNPWALTADGISETLFKQDSEGKLVSRLAESVQKKDDLTWELKLKEGMKFSDGTDLNAQAVADCINEIMANNEMATASAGVITATAQDDLTVQLVTERPTTVMESVLCEWTNVVYKGDSESGYVFTGPYVVKNLDPGVSLELEPNTYYDDKAAERSEVKLMAFADATAMKQAFEAEEIDMAFTVTPETALALEGEGYTVKNMNAGYQYFGMLNMKKEPFEDQKVRQAVNLAINREDMITALKGGRVATGFFASYYDFAGEVSETTDVEEAKALLAEAGYVDSDNDGILDKDGEKLSVSMVTYPSRPDLSILMQLTADNLNEIGIEVSTQIVESIDQYLKEGEWDMAFYAQHTAPTGEPAYALNMFFRTDAGKNHYGYSNEKVDSLLDQMGTMEASPERNELAKEVQAQVGEDLPVIYLVDPQWNIAVSEKLADYEPYCGDYYVVNDQLGL